MSLKDPNKKMSKSDLSDYSRINMNDSANQIAEKIKKAKTDSSNLIDYDLVNKKEISNLIDIMCAL